MRTHLERLETLLCRVIDGGVEGKASPDAISALQFAVGAVRDEMYLASHPMADSMKRTQEIMQQTAALGDAGWQDISTAPSNERVLVCGFSRIGYYCTDAKLIDGLWFLFDPAMDDYTAESEGHISWQPLPTPTVTRHKRGDV